MRGCGIQHPSMQLRRRGGGARVVVNHLPTIRRQSILELMVAVVRQTQLTHSE